MKRLKYISLALSLGLLLFNSCKKDNGYDWASYTPAPLGINGVTEVIANTNLTYEYSTVGMRGGSTYTWAVIEGADMVSITAQTGDNYNKATLAILQESATQKAAQITVFETTAAGVVCPKDTISIVIKPYVAVDLDAFCGPYVEADDAGSDGIFTCDVTIARNPADQYFGLVITGILNTDWWWNTPGSLKIQVFGVDNSLNFSKQTTGIIGGSYGPVSMELSGGVKGSINTTSHTLTYVGKITVAAGTFGVETFTYTPAKK